MLERLNIPFEVIPADIEEQAKPDESGPTLALRLAEEKAAHVAASHASAIVIGCDQVAECDGRLLGKPGSVDKALEQLSFTSGKDLYFHSAMAIVQGQKKRIVNVPTHVRMRHLPKSALLRYINQDQPLDCAGAMRSESMGIALTEFIRSDDPSALIGLPMIALTTILLDFGIDVMSPDGADN